MPTDGKVFVSTEHMPLVDISAGLEDVFKMPNITRVLVKREYSNEDILKILGKNHLRVFKEVLGN